MPKNGYKIEGVTDDSKRDYIYIILRFGGLPWS